MPDEAQKNVEGAAGVRTHDNGRTQKDEASSRVWRGSSGRFLPRAGDVDGKAPCLGHAGFVAPENTRKLVIRGVVAVRVNSGGARLEPNTRRMNRAGNCFADDTSGFNARV